MNRESFLQLISGQRRGAAASFLRGGLWLASGPYALFSLLRNRAYDLGLARIHPAGLPVVSIGNLTTGGTGKTPFAAWVARWYRERGVRVCLVSRGYGAEPGAPNDEALVLEQLCPDVPHLQDPDRVRSAHVAREELASQLILLDDGFQHRRLARDLDIVLIDALNPFGHGQVLPRGLLREPRRSLRRARQVVVTRVDQVSSLDRDRLLAELRALHPAADIAEVAFPNGGLISAQGRREPLEWLRQQRVAAFCGIGNPASFQASLKSAGAVVVAFEAWADHQAYGREQITQLEAWIRQHGPQMVLTTQKDLVKIQAERLAGVPLWALEQEVAVTSGLEGLERNLSAILSRIPADE
jgi:tetraacyldisaccharide 4'-kinase